MWFKKIINRGHASKGPNYLNLSVKQIYECATGKDFTEIKKGISKKDRKNLVFILKRVNEQKRIDFITYVMDECYSTPISFTNTEKGIDKEFGNFIRLKAFRNLEPVAKMRNEFWLENFFNHQGGTMIKALATDMCYPDSPKDYFGFPRKVNVEKI